MKTYIDIDAGYDPKKHGSLDQYRHEQSAKTPQPGFGLSAQKNEPQNPKVTEAE